MSFMIDELVTSISYIVKVSRSVTHQRILLPDPATKPETISGLGRETMENHTIPVGP
jgi:hypothetical protein